MQNPHDRFFRRVFSDPEHAAGELKAVLPAELAGRVDWSSLRVVPGSYVDAELSDLRSDVLLAATLGNHEILFYVLLEHQSTAHNWMPLKLLGYMVRIWEDYLREQPRAQRLPPIMPVVVYHGDSGWTTRVALVELLDLDPAASALLAAHIPNFEFRLDDLSSARAEDLRSRAMTATAQLALFCLSRARKSGDFSAELELSWKDRMREVAESPNGVAALGTVLRYILEASETPPERIRSLVRQLGPRAEEAYMTGAQILRAEGEAKGRAEGEAKGRADVLLKLLAVKFGPLPEASVERVRSASVEDLDRWAERVISATSLETALAD